MDMSLSLSPFIFRRTRLTHALSCKVLPSPFKWERYAEYYFSEIDLLSVWKWLKEGWKFGVGRKVEDHLTTRNDKSPGANIELLGDK
jgi:hypothetical protein